MKFHRPAAGLSIAALALFTFSPLPSNALPRHNVPDGVALAHYEGRVDPGTAMNLTVMLKMHNRAELDRAVEDLYDPASSTYHQWLTSKDFEKYAPTPAEFDTVRDALVKQGFTVISSDPLRFSIRVHGTAAIVEKAFQTELDNFSYNGRTFQAHMRDAHLAGPADDLIDAVSGIERHESRPQLSFVRNPRTGKAMTKKPLASRTEANAFLNSFTDTPLSQAATKNFGSGALTASYTGYIYAENAKMGGLTPAQLQAHYGVPFTQGSAKYDGTGETIALVEAYGYPQAEADANLAATQLFNLPKLTAANFKVVYPEGKPIDPSAASLTGWEGEIGLDIQSAHAMAPGAKILVVASSGQDNEDQINSLNYVINTKGKPLAYAVSSSWENDSEFISGRLEENAFNNTLELGAAAGVSFQFSSGDGGDEGLGTPDGAVSVPSNSPYATAVGGTSILNNPYGTGQIVTGWGNDYVYLYALGVEDPLEGYFSGGAGGGESDFYPRPTWQHKISFAGTGRLVPDVAALADPYTGFPVVLTENGGQYGYIYGGTSLASPVFTAIWAVADQYNGEALGQAAPALAKLTSTEINDVVPPTAAEDSHDVTGKIKDKTGTHTYTRTTLFNDANYVDSSGKLSLYTQGAFLSAIWPDQFASDEYVGDLSFGTDSSLTVRGGWDDVTGWGEPNGMAFVQGVTGKTTGAKEGEK
jgi:subtilase family serine protease